jgi:3-methyladenine DNA glycosylase/8-oxoguanine DNA glycosylase
LRLAVPLPRDFSFDAVVRSHGWYDLPPFLYNRVAGVLTYMAPGPALLAFRGVSGRLEMSGRGRRSSALAAAVSRIFSLDLDLSGFDAMLGDEPGLRRALARGGGRMLRGATVFEDAVKMLLTTNCSWAATRGMVTRLVALAGGHGAFPAPAALARLRPRVLRDRVRCIDSGRLDLSEWERRDAPAEAVRAAILAEHGFGPYAAEGLLRILGRHEYLALDSWVRKQFRTLHPGPAKTVDRAIARRYARYGKYRGLALWLELTRGWHEGDDSDWS